MTDVRDTSEIVGAQVKAFRKDRDLTVRQFADLCAAAGWKVSPATIDNIEGVNRVPKGEEKPRPRREISVGELLVLAQVLGVHPVDLLVPRNAWPEDLVPLPPGIEVPAGDVRAWVGGYGFLQPPASFEELKELTRWVPEHRRRLLAQLWGQQQAQGWSPERESAENREQNLREDAVDPDRIGGSWGPDGYLRRDGVSFSAEKVRELVEIEGQRRAERHEGWASKSWTPEGNDAPGRE